jgi:hypothetical protein
MPNTRTELRDELLDRLRADPLAIAPIIESLKSNTGQGLLIDPRNEPTTFETWMPIYGSLLNSKLWFQAAEVVMAWYQKLNELQVQDNARYHKGGAVHNTGHCYFTLGDMARGVWFFVCAVVEDILSRNDGTIPQTPATQGLRVQFNWTQSDFQNIADAAQIVRNEGGDLWWFPETTVVRLAREGKLRIPLSRNGDDIAINKPFLRKLIDRLPLGSPDDRKKSLEFLASYLTVTLPGVRIRPNVRSFSHAATFEHEIDLVAIQYGAVPTYLLEALGRQFLIECKNWDGPVGVRDLNHFVAKMRFHRCNCGVIFSYAGLSGDADAASGLRYARVTQLRWYQQDSCVVIVITNDDLNNIVGGTRMFSEILLSGYESVRFSVLDG